jgi:hypothetical protein
MIREFFMKRILTGVAVSAGLAFAAAPANAAQITGTAAPGFTNADAMTITKAPPFTVLDNRGVTAAQEATCSVLLLNGCLYTMNPGVGILVNTGALKTIIYTDATKSTISAVFGTYCVANGGDCTDVLAFVAAKPGQGALDLTLLGDITNNPFGILGTGPGGTQFSADAYLTPGETNDAGIHANFLAANVAAVPEPLTLSLFGAGLAGVIGMRRRKQK